MFVVTFSTSVLTASLGIAKFLKTGPCRLLPDQGPVGGHATLGFFLLMVNIATTIVSKGIILPAIGYEYGHNSRLFQSKPTAIGVWIAICYLPQLLYVSSNSRIVKPLSINTFCFILELNCPIVEYWFKEVFPNDHPVPCPPSDSSFHILDIWGS